MSTTSSSTTCHFCGAEGRHVNANHWTGSDDFATACTQEWGPRIDVCADCRHLVVDFPKRPRKPRTARKPQALYGDFAQLAAFSGIRTDGSGKVNR